MEKKNQNTVLSKVPPSEGFREAYTLHLADNALILGQRNAEWCGHGPVLEQDIAITNISLDLIGQARHFYQYAAQLINESQKAEGCSPSPLERELEGEVSEDSLAYLRTEREFKNLLLLEQPRGDWAQTILRQFLFSQYQYLLFQQLQNSKDEQLAAIAVKSLKEVTYHIRWSSEWVIRLGDSTEESNSRIKNAVDELWNYTGEFFETSDYELRVASEGIGVDVSKLKDDWMKKVTEVFDEATITIPDKTLLKTGGKNGIHSEHLGTILTDLQYLQRTYPGAEW